MQIPLIRTKPCNPDNKCHDDLCPKSATSICCKRCGTPDHITQIQQNYEEMSQDPNLTHPAIWQEMEAVIQHLKINHKCRSVTLPCKGTRIFLLRAPSPSL